VLMDKVGMLLEPCAQALLVAGIDEIDGAAKDGVFDAFVVRQIETVGERGLFNVALEAGPTRESALAGDGELGVTEQETGVMDFCVGGVKESGMKLADELHGVGHARGMVAHQVFGLVLEVIEIRVGREFSYRHDELPFARPMSACVG
jgi:hypothetical protein